MSSRLTIKQYWKRMALVIIEMIIVSAALFVFADVQNAELSNASNQNQVLAILFVGLILLNGVAAYVYTLVTILRRARDAGYTLPLFLVGAIVPFGFIIVGLMPGKK